MSPRTPMKTRNVRVSDHVWAAAQKAADERGENLSEEIRASLVRYAKRRQVMSDSDEDEPRDPPVLQEDGSLLVRNLPNGDRIVASKGWVSMSEDEAYADLPELFLVEGGDGYDVFAQALFPDEAAAMAWAATAGYPEVWVEVMRGPIRVRQFRVPADKEV